jgi:hypothetical protein
MSARTSVGAAVAVCAPRRVQVGKLRRLRVGDGGFTAGIRVNRKVAIVVGLFRLDRAIAEIDARGARGKSGLLDRTRALLRTNADRIRAGLSPLSVSPPTIAGAPRSAPCSSPPPGPGAPPRSPRRSATPGSAATPPARASRSPAPRSRRTRLPRATWASPFASS